MAASRLHQLILVLASGLSFKSITPDALTPLSLKMPTKDSESVDVRLTIERYLVLDFLLCFHRNILHGSGQYCPMSATLGINLLAQRTARAALSSCMRGLLFSFLNLDH